MKLRLTGLLSAIIFFLSLQGIVAQSVGINSDNSLPNPSAMLDVKSANKGVLFPRLTNAQMIGVQNPAAGLIIFNVDEKDLFIYKSGAWSSITGEGGAGHWLTTPDGIFYPNGAGVGTNILQGKFHVLNNLTDFSPSAIKIDNYFEGPEDKYGINLFTSDGGVGNHYGLYSIATANTESTATYGLYSYVIPNSTIHSTYAIYGEVLDEGPGEKWAGYFEGNTRVSKMLRVGEGGGFETGLFKVMNDQESTAAFISNSYSGSSQANGLSLSVSGSSGHQFGVLSSMTPNGDATKTSVGFSTNVPFFSGGAVGKEVIGFQANMFNGTLGTKYGIKINATGSGNWAAFLNGRTYISERTIIGDDDGLNGGALSINNDGSSAGTSNLHLRNSYTSTTSGINNLYTASSSPIGTNYGQITTVLGTSGGAKTLYGHFIDMSGATGTGKRGLRVNSPGSQNWAAYLQGRSYISEELLVGTTDGAAGYKMSVDGKIACEEVRVEMSQDWPDYVFQKSYDLKTIEELEKSIETNGHLPGIPSANEIENNGLEMGEMQRLMMEKIEELTLYIIELNKENQKLNKRIIELEKRD